MESTSAIEWGIQGGGGEGMGEGSVRVCLVAPHLRMQRYLGAAATMMVVVVVLLLLLLLPPIPHLRVQ